MNTETRPTDPITGFNGMTKREYFAAMAMQAMMPLVGINENYAYNTIAYNACYIADELIQELNKRRKDIM